MARTKLGAAVKWGILGAAATWFLDPERGSDRRRQVQDKVLGAVRKRKDELRGNVTAPSSNGHSTPEPAPEPLPDLVAEEIQLEPGAPGGPTVAPPT